MSPPHAPTSGPDSDPGYVVSIGDDLIAEALAAVERRAEESRAARLADDEDEDDDDVDVVFDDAPDDETEVAEGMTVDLGDLDSLLAEADADADAEDDDSELGLTRTALRAAEEALEVAELALQDAETERDEALAARAKSRRTAKKYKAALEREVEQRQRLGSTQKMLRDRLGRMEARLQDSEEERTALADSVQVLNADLERARRDIRRLKKREDQTRAAASRKAVERACKELLPVFDNLGLALSYGSERPEQVLEGVLMVAKQFETALGKVGLERVPAEPGAPFDPGVHEAMQMLPTAEHAPNTIHAVLQAGFSIDGQLVRAARVVVATAPPAPAPEPEPEPEPEASSDQPEASAEPLEAAAPELDASLDADEESEETEEVPRPEPDQTLPEVESEPDPT